MGVLAIDEALEDPLSEAVSVCFPGLLLVLEAKCVEGGFERSGAVHSLVAFICQVRSKVVGLDALQAVAPRRATNSSIHGAFVWLLTSRPRDL